MGRAAGAREQPRSEEDATIEVAPTRECRSDDGERPQPTLARRVAAERPACFVAARHPWMGTTTVAFVAAPRIWQRGACNAARIHYSDTLLGQTPAPVEERLILLRPGWIVDVQRGERVAGKAILVRGERIVDVRDAAAAPPAGAQVKDLPGVTLLPGLIDAHVHLAWGGPAGPGLPGVDAARATLEAGFTTVRNLGSTGQADFRLREAIERGEVAGPRMLVSGPGMGTKRGVCESVFQGEGTVGSMDEAAGKVRQLIGLGADVIKVCAGGGVIATAADAESIELGEDQLRAIVAEAHRLGRKVSAHAQGPAAIRNAVLAGVDSIEHGSLLDEPVARLMKERGVTLVPTLRRLDFGLDQQRAAGAPEARLTALKDSRDQTFKRLAAAAALGVPIVLGTDATVLPHGRNAEELEALVAIGLSPVDALRAATVRAAELLGWADRVGEIRAGFYADLVGVECDPLSGPSCLKQPVFVMKGGAVHREPAPPKAPADTQPSFM